MRKCIFACARKSLGFPLHSRPSHCKGILGRFLVALGRPHPRLRGTVHATAQNAAPHHCNMDGEAIRQIRSTPPPMREACTGRLANLMAALGHQLRPSLARPASAHPTSPRRYLQWHSRIRLSRGASPPSCSFGPQPMTRSSAPYIYLLCSRCVDGASSERFESFLLNPSMNPRWRAPAPVTMSPPSRR